MEFFDQIELGRREALYLLAIIQVLLAAHFWQRHRNKQAWQLLAPPEARERLIPGYRPARKSFRFFLALMAFVLGVLALAHPRVPEVGEAEVRRGIDHMVALDISNSMLANDVAPSRLERARELLLLLLQRRANDRIGLIVFAGNAYVQLPLTYDHDAARMFLETANPAQAGGQGTAIGAALERCRELFGEPNGRYRSVLLLTDGETHDEMAAAAAKELARSGVRINTIGIGSPRGSTLRDAKTGSLRRDEQGQVVVSRLNETLLQELANIGQGRYLLADRPEAAAQAISENLAQLPTSGLIDKSRLNYRPLYQWLLLPMLFLLLLETFWPERKNQSR